MPFTLSHAAAALPFQKLKPIWPALVIGTFAPDLQYFIWISDEDRSGHHFPGIVLLAIPLALLLLWLFECCVKGPAIELLPNGVQLRLQDKVQPLSFWGWGRFASIVLWIAIGIATHVIWDQFTHYNTRAANRWDWLHRSLSVPFYPAQPVTHVLQHLSTVVGLLALLAWFAAWYRRTPPAPRARLRTLSPFRKVTTVFAIAVIAIAVGYPLAILRLADHAHPIPRLFFIATVIEAVTLVFCAQVLIYGVARTIGARGRRIPAARLHGPNHGV